MTNRTYNSSNRTLTQGSWRCSYGDNMNFVLKVISCNFHFRFLFSKKLKCKWNAVIVDETLRVQLTKFLTLDLWSFTLLSFPNGILTVLKGCLREKMHIYSINQLQKIDKVQFIIKISKWILFKQRTSRNPLTTLTKYYQINLCFYLFLLYNVLSSAVGLPFKFQLRMISLLLIITYFRK